MEESEKFYQCELCGAITQKGAITKCECYKKMLPDKTNNFHTILDPELYTLMNKKHIRIIKKRSQK